MREEPLRLVEASYPLIVRVSSRFSDVIRDGHLNNAILANYYEEARRSLERSLFAGEDWPDGPYPVVVQTQTRFLAAGSYPGDLHVGSGISRIGGSSFHIAQALFQEGRCLGLCDTVMVHLGEAGAAPMPASYRRRLEAHRFAATEGAANVNHRSQQRGA